MALKLLIYWLKRYSILLILPFAPVYKYLVSVSSIDLFPYDSFNLGQHCLLDGVFYKRYNKTQKAYGMFYFLYVMLVISNILSLQTINRSFRTLKFYVERKQHVNVSMNVLLTPFLDFCLFTSWFSNLTCSMKISVTSWHNRLCDPRQNSIVQYDSIELEGFCSSQWVLVMVAVVRYLSPLVMDLVSYFNILV